MTQVVQKGSFSLGVSGGGAGLAELAGAIIKLLTDVIDKGFDGDADQLRRRFDDAFTDYERHALRGGAGETEVGAAKYALVALVDETILLSDLAVKDDWLGRPLQLQYFDDFSAGEEFYNKLEALRLARSERSAEVLEVYHLCMSLGFKGKYGDARGEERRKVLIEAVAKDVAEARGAGPDQALSPQGLPASEGGVLAVSGRSLPIWVVPLAVAVVILASLVVTGLISDRQIAAFPSGDAVGAKP